MTITRSSLLFHPLVKRQLIKFFRLNFTHHSMTIIPPTKCIQFSSLHLFRTTIRARVAMASSQFRSILLLIAIYCVFSLAICEHVVSVDVREGEGFLVMLKHKRGESECILRHAGINYNMTDKPKLGKNGEILDPVPNKEICLIRIYGARKTSGGEWMITNNRGSSNRVIVTIIPADSEAHCPENDTPHCKLIHLITNEERKCGADVHDWGDSFKCQYQVKGMMQHKVEFMNKRTHRNRVVKSTDIRYKDPIEDHFRIILECKTEDFSSIKRCSAAHLNSGRVFNVEDGLQGERYSAFQTDFASGICQFEIPKPINPIDHGRWRLRITTDRDEKRMCHFVVAGPGPKQKRQTRLEDRPSKNMLKGASIKCDENAAHSVHRCFIRTPEFKLIFDKTCTFTLTEVGDWVCGYNAESKSDPDIQQKIIVYDNAAIEGKANENDRSVECHHIYKSPLQTCLFISPKNVPHDVPSEEFESDAYSYYKGSGHLATGDCGIQFRKEKDFLKGTWKCIIKVGNGADYSSVAIGNGVEVPKTVITEANKKKEKEDENKSGNWW